MQPDFAARRSSHFGSYTQAERSRFGQHWLCPSYDPNGGLWFVIRSGYITTERDGYHHFAPDLPGDRENRWHREFGPGKLVSVKYEMGLHTPGAFLMQRAVQTGQRRKRTHRRRLIVESLETRELLAGDISGVQFSDLNDNGVQDAGEPGLAGVIVFVDANNNAWPDPDEHQAVSASDGSYTITNVDRGYGFGPGVVTTALSAQ